MTQMWPSPASPSLGIFVQRQRDALVALGADVTVASIPPGPGGLRSPLKWRRLMRAATDAARAERPDVVLGHFLFPGGEAARRAALVAGVPYAVVAHGQDVRNAERSWWLRLLTARVLRGAALLVAVSDDLAERLGRVCALPSHLLVSHMGVDRDAFRPGDRDAASRGLDRAPARPLVVQVGVKNAAVLAAAAAEAGATLWLAGAGPAVPGATMLGTVAPAAMPDLLRAADCVAFVPEREGFGLAALEAVACGVPLVVSRTVPVAASLPSTAAVPVDPSDQAAVAAGIRLALALPRDDPAGQQVADASATTAMAARLLQELDRLR